MDGGVAYNTPISHAVGSEPERCTCSLRDTRALEQPPASALGMALHALTLLAQSRLIADVESHRDLARLVVMPSPCPLAIQPIDFAHAEELVERSLADARTFLDGGGAERPAIRMRVHRHVQPHARKKRPAGVT